MANIGLVVDQDSLVLTRGRDFKWSFENLDENDSPVDYPPGELFFELDTGGEHNAVQSVSVIGASSGSYKLGVLGSNTANIDFNDVSENPQGLAGDITDALEAVPAVGLGNVEVSSVSLVPIWELRLTLNAGNNEIQLVTFTGNPTGGNWRLGYGLALSALMPFGATPAVVQSTLEAVPGIGAGNVGVQSAPGGGYRIEFKGTLSNTDVQQLTGFGFGFDLTLPAFFYGLTGGFFPGVQTSTIVPGTTRFSEQLVNTLNKTVNDLFNSFEALLGVDINYRVEDTQNVLLTVTSLRSFAEVDLNTFITGVTSNQIKAALNNVATLAGVFNTINVNFYWNRKFQVEFVNELGNRPIPKMTADTALLGGGPGLTPSVAIDVLEPGKERFTIWEFDIEDALAQLKVESEAVDQIGSRTRWQLVFMPAGEAAGGDPVGRGTVTVQL